jgi:hypothetical protein
MRRLEIRPGPGSNREAHRRQRQCWEAHRRRTMTPLRLTAAVEFLRVYFAYPVGTAAVREAEQWSQQREGPGAVTLPLVPRLAAVQAVIGWLWPHLRTLEGVMNRCDRPRGYRPRPSSHVCHNPLSKGTPKAPGLIGAEGGNSPTLPLRPPALSAGCRHWGGCNAPSRKARARLRVPCDIWSSGARRVLCSLVGAVSVLQRAAVAVGGSNGPLFAAPCVASLCCWRASR